MRRGNSQTRLNKISLDIFSRISREYGCRTPVVTVLLRRNNTPRTASRYYRLSFDHIPKQLNS